eukprot:jgi/Pico_ML_1/51596/g2594.t1
MSQDMQCPLHAVSKEKEKERRQAKWKLSCIAGLVLLFLSVEVAGGIRSGSLAILTDAAHLLTDAIGIFISLFALMMSAKKPTKTMSYGYHRLEILGALISVLLIWAVTGVLVVEATMRIMQPVDVDGKLMLLVASFGIFMNVIMACCWSAPQTPWIRHRSDGVSLLRLVYMKSLIFTSGP